MGKISVKIMVEGGKAIPGPPLGPALAVHKVNIGQVVAAINEATKEFKGITVPVEVIVDTETKAFEIKVGTPPVSALIKKELKVEKLAITPWTTPPAKEGEAPKEPFKGDLPFEAAVRIANAKMSALGTRSLKNAVKQVIGSCMSVGCTVEGKNPKDILKEINAGKWDAKIKG
ncbi:MAG: 50S ribosomal protein L11 [Candidatus Aenigmatarchaeota archaeon]|nr:50S ribosomal protein L11 [Candidatus Aenigmarchaeota archaeon]